MNKKIFALTSALLLCMSGVALANDELPETPLEQLMEKSGINEQIKQLPEHVQSGVDEIRNQNEDMTSENFDEIYAVIKESFDPAVVTQDIKTYLANQLEDAEIRGILEWLESPLGELITDFEEKASTPEAYEKIRAQFASLQEDPGRVDLMRQLDRAIRATDSMVMMSENMQIAISMALMADLPKEEQMTQDQITYMVHKNRVQLKAAYKDQIIASFLYTYQDLSVEELNGYIGFAESEAGKKYHSAMMEAFNAAFVSASEKFGNSLLANLTVQNQKLESE